jgi:site-specific recombinase XerD
MNEIRTTTVSVYTRHIPVCSFHGDIYYRGRGCNCPKWLYVYDGHKARRVSARTRTWAKAEIAADRERARLDPVKRRLLEIEEQQQSREREAEEKKAAALASRITINNALDRWLASEKNVSDGTLKAYTSSARRMRRWSERVHLTYLDEITANMLDEWRSTWSKNSKMKHDRMGATTQSSFLVRMKAFFKWATRIKLIAENPAKELERIRPKFARPQFLTPKQFEQLLAAIEPFTAAAEGEVRGLGNEFRALFLLQRSTGMRLIDCLALPRTSVKGDRMRTFTQKTNAKVERRLPIAVMKALSALAQDREGFKPGYFFWGSGITTKATLSSRWAKITAGMNPYLNFVNEDGQPFKFHSHVLRDTFAIDLILSGMKLEDVSRLLTHESIKTTETHYTYWIKPREERLAESLEAALAGMGMAFAAAD